MDKGKLIRRALAECNTLEGCYPALWRAHGLEEACEATRALVNTLWDDMPRAFPDDREQLRGYCRELQNAFNRGKCYGGAPGYFSPVLAKIRAYLTAKAEPPKPPEPTPEPEPEPAPPEQPKKRRFGIFKS